MLNRNVLITMCMELPIRAELNLLIYLSTRKHIRNVRNKQLIDLGCQSAFQSHANNGKKFLIQNKSI